MVVRAGNGSISWSRNYSKFIYFSRKRKKGERRRVGGEIKVEKKQ